MQERVAGWAAAPACATIPQNSKGAEEQQMRSETSAELLWWGSHSSPASALPQTHRPHAGCPNGSHLRSRWMELKLLIRSQGWPQGQGSAGPQNPPQQSFLQQERGKTKNTAPRHSHAPVR